MTLPPSKRKRRNTDSDDETLNTSHASEAASESPSREPTEEPPDTAGGRRALTFDERWKVKERTNEEIRSMSIFVDLLLYNSAYTEFFRGTSRQLAVYPLFPLQEPAGYHRREREGEI